MGNYEGGIFSGTLYGDFEVDGKWTGKKKVGNSVKFEMKADAEKKDMPSRERGKYGQTRKSVTLPKPSSIAISINDPVREVLAQGFLGKIKTLATAGGSVTSEAHDAPAPGNGIDLTYRDVSSVTIARKNGQDAIAWSAAAAKVVDDYVIPTVTNQHFYKCTVAGDTDATEPASWPTDGSTVSDGAVTWQDMGLIEAALNTDFTLGVDGARLGMPSLTETTSIVQGEPLLADYTYAARAGYKIEGANQPIAKARWMLDGENLANGNNVIINVFESQNMPTSPIDFLSDNYQSVDLTCTPLTPDDKDHPWSVEYPDAVA